MGRAKASKSVQKHLINLDRQPQNLAARNASKSMVNVPVYILYLSNIFPQLESWYNRDNTSTKSTHTEIKTCPSSPKIRKMAILVFFLFHSWSLV